MRYACSTRLGPSRVRTATDSIRQAASRIAREFLGMTRPSSAPRTADLEGESLRGTSRPPAGVGRGHEGDDQRGPQFRDCARMVHKTANVLDKLPKGSQAKAKGMLHEIYLAETKAEA